MLKNPKRVVTFLLTLTLLQALTQPAKAQSSNETQTFFSTDYAGISIAVNATKETIPGGDLTISLWVNCTSDGVKVDYLNFSVYGFRNGQERILLNTTCTPVSGPMILNATVECSYNVSIPGDVWDATYGELALKYVIVDETLERNAGFPMTIVKNVYLDELEEQLTSLNESYQQLNSTYWELQQNYTSLQASINELENTRNVVTILAVTTVIFIATTIYLIMRRTKQYW